MWDKAAFLSFFAGLCLANRVALASWTERDARIEPRSGTSLRFLERMYRRDLPLAPLFIPDRQADVSSGAGAAETAASTGTAGDSTSPSVIAVGLQPSEISELASVAATLAPTDTETVLFLPASGTQSASLEIPTATATQSNGAPQASQQVTGTAPNPQNIETGAALFSFSYPIIDTIGLGAPTASVDSSGAFSFSIPIPTAADSRTFTAPFSSGIYSFSIPVPFSTSALASHSVSISNSWSYSTATQSTSLSSATSSATQSSSTSSSQTSSSTKSSSTSGSSSSSSSSAKTGSLESLASAGATGPGKSRPLSPGAIAGIVVGAAAALVLLGALLLCLPRRRNRRTTTTSPRVYPEEAYLYDPPMDDSNAPAMSGPAGPTGGYHAIQPAQNGPSGQGMTAPGAGQPYNPYVVAAPAGAVAVGAGAARGFGGRSGYARVPSGSAALDGAGSGYISPPQRSLSPPRGPNTAGGISESSNLLAPASAAIAPVHRAQQPSLGSSISAPARDSLDIRTLDNPFVDPSDPSDLARQELWPLNPNGENGLTPPGTAGPGAPLNPSAGAAYNGVSPGMREVRRAWGWEE